MQNAIKDYRYDLKKLLQNKEKPGGRGYEHRIGFLVALKESFQVADRVNRQVEAGRWALTTLHRGLCVLQGLHYWFHGSMKV